MTFLVEKTECKHDVNSRQYVPISSYSGPFNMIKYEGGYIICLMCGMKSN